MARIIRVDFTGVESGGAGVRVPAGDYALKVVKIETKKGKESDQPNLKFHLELSKGPKKGNGKTIIHNCSLQKQALWNLRNLLEACGKTVPSKAVKMDLDKFIELECAGTIVDGEYNGRPKSEVAAFYPLEDLGNTMDADEELESEEDLEEEPKPKKKVKKAAVEEEEEEEEPAPKKKLKKKPAEEEEEEEAEEEDLFN